VTIDRDRKIPLYGQLELDLQDKILVGKWGPGVLLPTEMQLCELYNVSRITVRKALDKLDRKGLITKIKGRGSIVNRIEPTITSGGVYGYTKLMEDQGFTPSSKIIKTELVQDNEELFSLFNFEDAEERKCWHIVRLRSVNGKPSVLMNHYVKKSLGDKMMAYDLDKYSFFYLYELLTEKSLLDGDSMIAPIHASQEIANLLDIKFSSMVVWLRSITYFDDHTTAEVNYSFYNGEDFMFRSKSFLPTRSNNEQYRGDGLSPLKSDS
jgi:DNA-binding GntR family transcriptional regulator